MKFIIGTFRFKSGARDAVLADVQPLIEEVRREEGNVFFEFNPKPSHQDAASANTNPSRVSGFVQSL